jgi:hypothetical protein
MIDTLETERAVMGIDDDSQLYRAAQAIYVERADDLTDAEAEELAESARAFMRTQMQPGREEVADLLVDNVADLDFEDDVDDPEALSPGETYMHELRAFGLLHLLREREG